MITVVTITYNNYTELLETLDSLESCCFDNQIESLVINGGDCKDTLSFLKSYKGRSISGPDNGIADAFNKGIENARGDYIAFLNSGDILKNKTYYQEALSYLIQHPSCDYIYGSGIFRHKDYGELLIQPNLEEILIKMPLMHCSMVVKKSVLSNIGNFDTRFKIAMDYNALIKMHTAGAKGHHLKTSPCVLMDGTGVSSLNGEKGAMECILTLRENNTFALSSKIHYSILFFKFLTRKILDMIHLLSFYDKVRISMNKRKLL